MSMLRLPAELQYSRDVIRVITETGVIITLGFFLIKYNKWIGMFALLAVFSSCYPVLDINSYFTRSCIFYGLVWYTIIILTFNKDTVKYLLWGMCGIAFVHIVFLVWQSFGLDPYRTFTFGLMETKTMGAPTGIMTMTNEASGLLALTAPAFLVNRYLRFGLILVLISLLIVPSAGGVVSVYAGAMFYTTIIFWGSWRILAGILLINCIGMGLYLKFGDPPGYGRISHWIHGWGYYKEHWIMGYGLGHWKSVTKRLHAHNDIIQVVFEMGIGAGVLIIGYLTNAFRTFTRDALIPATALIIILVHSCYSFLWCVGTTAIISVTWLSILQIRSE